MNRRIFHALLWMLCLAVAAAFVIHWLKKPTGTGEGFSVPDTARARSVVMLEREKWTIFRIPSGAMRIKLLSRANLNGGMQSLADQEFPYQIEYRVEKLTGATFAEGIFALTAKVTPMVDTTGSPQLAVFFGGSSLIPASAKISSLDLDTGELLILKLRARSDDARIADISVTTFLHQPVPERKMAYLWDRTSPVYQERIGKLRIHALVDLTMDEKRAILQNRWIPFGAQGVEGFDYHERMMYLRDDLLPAKRQFVEPLGFGEILCGPNRRAIVGVPQPGGFVRLEFRRKEEGAATRALVRFFGETMVERSTQEHLLDASLTNYSATIAGGMLEIESPVDVAVRPFWTPAGQGEQLLQGEPSVVRTWRTNANEPVAFSLGGDRSRTDFFRVSVRPVAVAGTTLSYEFLDGRGAVILKGEREIQPVPSLYDVLLTPDTEEPVNDPVELMFELPPGVTAIRFQSAADSLLNAYTRPSNLTHRTRVPQDYVRALPDPDRLPIWFAMLPDGSDDLIRSSRSFLIHTQTRPPEDDANILAGKYQWEDFQPAEGALGQYLLSDRDADSPGRDEALPALFMPLSVGQEQALALDNPPGLTLPSRRLVFVRERNEPVSLKIFVDGAAFFERDLVTDRGELLLPPIAPESRTIRIECAAPDLKCFLNYVAREKATKLKRLAQRVSPGTSLLFQCEKLTNGDELLTGMFFAPPGTKEEAEIHVALRPGTSGGFLPLAETFTLRLRTYRVKPEATLNTPLLGGRIPAVDGGRRFFIPLGSDMKAGVYQVSISLHDGTDGYMTLSKITGGNYSDARFFREASQ